MNHTHDLPQAVRLPKQRRSEEVLDRIVLAARELLAEREFHEISVADIATRAGVSVGIVYTRFATKEHLLVHLARELSVTLATRVEKVLGEAGTRGMSLLEVAETYFTLAAHSFSRHRSVLKPLSLIVRLERHRELRDLVSQFNQSAHSALRTRLLEHRKEIAHANAEYAVDVAIHAASAALRESVLYGEPVSSLAKHKKNAARDAAHVCVSYLVWKPQ